MSLFRPTCHFPEANAFLKQSKKHIPSASNYLFFRSKRADGDVTEGLIGEIDLEAYSPHIGMGLPIRPAQFHPGEKPVADFLPLLLMDDWGHTVIEPIASHRTPDSKIGEYAENDLFFELYSLSPEETNAIDRAISVFSDVARFKTLYHTDSDAPLVFAVGKGNPILVGAKRRWEQEKKGLTPIEQETHPHRWVPVKLMNLYSPGIAFLPIHRTVRNVEASPLIDYLVSASPAMPLGQGATIKLFSQRRSHSFCVSEEVPAISFTDRNLKRFAAAHPECDIQSADETAMLECSKEPDTVGIRLPNIRKEQLFLGIVSDGILPEHSFHLEI